MDKSEFNDFVFIDDIEPIWCNSIDKDNVIIQPNDIFIQELKNQLDNKATERETFFHNLMNIDVDSKNNYILNIDYISNFKDMFNIDINCLCKTLQLKDNPNTNYVYYIGKQFGSGATGVASQICVRNESKREFCPLIMKAMANSTMNDYLSLRISGFNNLTFLTNIMHNQENYNIWKIKDYKGYTSNKIISAGGSGFVNQTNIHIALNNILKNNPNYLYQYDAFFCNENKSGYNITELANSGDLSDFINKDTTIINDSVLLNILQQVFTPLFILKDPLYMFNHSDLKPRNVFVNVQDDGKFICKLADFDKSSIFWNGIRFYNNIIPSYIKGNFAGKMILEQFLNKCPRDYGYSYTLTTSVHLIQLFTMHNHAPSYQSYDFYTFIIGLITEPKVTDFLLSTNYKSEIFKIIKEMFTDKDIKTLITIMKEYNTTWKTGSEFDKEELLKRVVKLSNIKEMIINNELVFKKNVDFLIDMLDLKIPEQVSKQKPEIVLKKSYKNKLCKDKCKGYMTGNYCDTNKYSSKGLIYDNDYCTM